MSTCALVGAVEFNAEHFLAQDFDFVIAVDRGYDTLRAIGCKPDLIVGDFDSLGYVPFVETGENVLVFPGEKDESDMELAIAAADERGCDTLLLYGALAARLDHTLANLQLMTACARRGLRVFGIGAGFALTVLDGSGADELSLGAFDPCVLDDGLYGRYVSVFAYGGLARGVCERGLKYLLDNAEVPDDVSLGLSNEFIGEPASIEVREGNVVVTFSVDAWRYLTVDLG